MRRRLKYPAFTLLELVVVLLILCTAIAMAAPSLSGWSRASHLRAAGDEFLALSRWARSQAIADSRVHRLNVDAQNGRCWVTVEDGAAFVPVASDLARAFLMPDNASITMTRDGNEPLEFVAFHPTGRTTAPARVRITNDRVALDFVCETPSETFRLVTPGEPVQP